MKLTEAKLFPHLDDTPDSHKLRLVHSVTQYDRQNEARAERKGQKHNIYAAGTDPRTLPDIIDLRALKRRSSVEGGAGSNANR